MTTKYLKANCWAQRLLLVLFSIILVSCQAASAPDPFFPQQRDAHPNNMTAFLTGNLILINDCLRVRDTTNTSYLLIWPHGFSLNKKDNPMQLYDDKGQAVARVGDTLKIGGGEMRLEYVSNLVLQPVPANCSGPYWIVGEILK
jgi:hypothetical protein